MSLATTPMSSGSTAPPTTLPASRSPSTTPALALTGILSPTPRRRHWEPGLFQKIKHGYSHVASQFLPGDLIFIFGFSRGAYIARSLAGMIAVCGLPTVNENDPRCVDTAFEAYRNVAQRPVLLDNPRTRPTR